MIPLPTAITSQIGSTGFKFALIALALLAAAGGGAWLMAEVKDGEIATIHSDQAKAELVALRASLARIQAAKERGDTLEKRLAQAEVIRQQQAKEATSEIKRLTRGVPCLNAGTVRLLNQSSQGIHLATLPNTAGGAVAADAAVASDTDVAGWIDNAQRQYDKCRDRLQALIDWHKPELSE